jgi:mannose-1-phosphate guanylyltransferase/mannose-6-phosphate isomerase
LPKQFVNLLGSESLFQRAVSLATGDGFAAPLIVTGDPFRFIATEQLAAVEQSASAILIEPEGRNTAPAVLAAAIWLQRHDPDAIMLVLPSDHLIPDGDAFRSAVQSARPQAEAGDMVTFGVCPTRPETGYGYLELLSAEARDAATPQPLLRFVEKPDRARAEAMLASGNYLWNAGIFLFSVEVVIAAFKTHAPHLFEDVSQAVDTALPDLSFLRLASEPWLQAESISIDFAIMEKAQNLAVMPLATAWSDLGDWESVRQKSGPDGEGNVCSDQVLAIDCVGSLLRSEAEDLQLVGIGLTNMIAVAMRDAVLVAPRSESQRVGEAVRALKAQGVAQAESLPRDQRPWGWFESLAVGDRFQVKRIVVRPGAALSLQSHNHRAEHWIVVAGTAKVTIGGEVKLVTENQSVYVPLGEVHRLENPGKLPVELIEVQTGSYLGEDDIIRYADNYARN